jgi:hypothetical protein
MSSESAARDFCGEALASAASRLTAATLRNKMITTEQALKPLRTSSKT